MNEPVEAIDWRISTIPAISKKVLEKGTVKNPDFNVKLAKVAREVIGRFHTQKPNPHESFQLEQTVLRRAAVASDLHLPPPKAGVSLISMMANKRIPLLQHREIGKRAPSGEKCLDQLQQDVYRKLSSPPRSYPSPTETTTQFTDGETPPVNFRPFSQAGYVSFDQFLPPRTAMTNVTDEGANTSFNNTLATQQDGLNSTLQKQGSFYKEVRGKLDERAENREMTSHRKSPLRDPLSDTQSSWKTNSTAGTNRAKLLRGIHETLDQFQPKTTQLMAVSEATLKQLMLNTKASDEWEGSNVPKDFRHLKPGERALVTVDLQQDGKASSQRQDANYQPLTNFDKERCEVAFQHNKDYCWLNQSGSFFVTSPSWNGDETVVNSSLADTPRSQQMQVHGYTGEDDVQRRKVREILRATRRKLTMEKNERKKGVQVSLPPPLRIQDRHCRKDFGFGLVEKKVSPRRRLWRRNVFDPVEVGRESRRREMQERPISKQIERLAAPKSQTPTPRLTGYAQFLQEQRNLMEEERKVQDISRQIHLPVFTHAKSLV